MRNIDIVFRFPAKDRKQQNCGGSQYGKDFVKRVIAMPGDTVQIIEGRAWVNGKQLPQENYELYENLERVSYQEKEDPALYQKLWEEFDILIPDLARLNQDFQVIRR